MYSYSVYSDDYDVSLQQPGPSAVVQPQDYSPSSQDIGPNFTTSFSRGSPYVYSPQDYNHYLVDRGGLDSPLCSTSLVPTATTTLDATGIGFSGDPNGPATFTAQSGPEDIPAYGHQPPHTCHWDSWPSSSDTTHLS